MTKIVAVLVIALFFEAVGVIFLSKGLKQIGEVRRVETAEIIRIIKAGFLNKNVLLGVFLEAIFFSGLLYLLSQRDVSLIWPLTSLGFVVTTLAAKFLLKEEVDWIRWSGVFMIVGGAALITYSEKLKERRKELPPASSIGRRA